MRKADKAYNEALENNRKARKKVWDLEDKINKADKDGDKEKVSKLKKEQEKARVEWKRTSEEARKAKDAYSEQAKRYRAVKFGEKNLATELNKIRTDKHGQGLMPFAKKH